MERPLTRREFAARLAAGGAALAVPGWVAVGDAGAARSRALKRLAASVKGPVLTPANSAGLVFNSRYAGIRPMAVVRAAGPADVQACVRWARRNSVRITARSGGHSYAGYSTAQGGLVVDLRRLDSVSLSGRTVTAGRAPSSSRCTPLSPAAGPRCRAARVRRWASAASRSAAAWASPAGASG